MTVFVPLPQELPRVPKKARKKANVMHRMMIGGAGAMLALMTAAYGQETPSMPTVERPPVAFHIPFGGGGAQPGAPAITRGDSMWSDACEQWRQMATPCPGANSEWRWERVDGGLRWMTPRSYRRR